MLIKAVYKDLMKLGSSGLVGIAIPDIYMKLPYTATNRKGKTIEKMRFVPIAAVVATRLKEDEESADKTDDENESPATYRGASICKSISVVLARRSGFTMVFKDQLPTIGVKCITHA
ncbi:hypothetical protein [Ferviditalea candida]|uniref:Uncharacterized protein n=1 Tax=Ferviditalea candida TaxID=3108399 RepID=A0ABU5ZFR7_9BACL|nr:hypothetical protein [Paenibacillaceae bacterium T2]